MDFSYILSFHPFALSALALFVLAFLYLALYYGMVYLRVGRWHLKKQSDAETQPSDNLPTVSVVLTAHNDAEWLKENLIYLLEQDYPRFEVVVVDYLSNDDTQFVLQLCSENYPNLKTVSFHEDVNLFKGKKYPLSIGIKSAKYDTLLLAEPDCVPKDFNWIRSMVAGYSSNEKQIILGYCGVRQKKGLMNLLQVYDNLAYNVSFMAAAIMGHPYTGSGRNLSYRRSFFFHQGAFISHYKIEDGADDIFVNQNATARNTVVVLDEGSFVETEAPSSYRRWFQFRHHRNATKHLRPFSQRLTLWLYPFNVLLFYTFGILLVVMGWFPWQILSGVLLLKIAWQIIAVYQSVKRFKIKGVHWFSPLLEIYFWFSNTILSIVAFLKK